MLIPTYQTIPTQTITTDLVHAGETSISAQRRKTLDVGSVIKNHCFFQGNYFRNKDAGIRLLGEELDGILVTDQYSSYRHIDESKRQLSWAHILRSVIAIAESMNNDNQRKIKRLQQAWEAKGNKETYH